MAAAKANRGIRRLGAQGGILGDPRHQVVGVQLVAPTGMLPVLLGQLRHQGGAQGRMLALAGTDLALEDLDRPLLCIEGFVIPPLDGRNPEADPLAADRMPPFFGRPFFEEVAPATAAPPKALR